MQRIQLEIPIRTILKVLIAGAVVFGLVKLRHELVFLSVALLLAVALSPVVTWLGQHRVKRPLAVGLITLAGVVLIAVIITLLVPSIASQVVDLVQNLPQRVDQIKQSLPHNRVVSDAIDQLFQAPTSPQLKHQLGRALIWGQSALSGLVTTAVVLVITIYLLLDGKRLYAWLLAFVPRRLRDDMARTADEVSGVVHAYVRGQAVLSTLFSVYTAILLSIFHVPAALPLALFAGFCDIIPVAGIFVATLPAALLALTVSPVVGISVAALYLCYHLFEAYVLMPRLFGKMLKLSTLTVLLAMLIGGALQGIVGAVLSLPIVAAYPIFERIWLKRFFPDEVIEDHTALDRDSTRKEGGAVDKVLQGAPHRDTPATRH